MKIKPGTLLRARSTVLLIATMHTEKIPRGDIFMYLESQEAAGVHYQSRTFRHIFLTKNGKKVWRHTYGPIEGFINEHQEEIEIIDI